MKDETEAAKGTIKEELKTQQKRELSYPTRRLAVHCAVMLLEPSGPRYRNYLAATTNSLAQESSDERVFAGSKECGVS